MILRVVKVLWYMFHRIWIYGWLKLIGSPSKMSQALRLKLALRGVPYRTGCWPLSALGEGVTHRVLQQLGEDERQRCRHRRRQADRVADEAKADRPLR